MRDRSASPAGRPARLGRGHRAAALAATLLLGLATGCAQHQFGPQTVGPAQRGYNEALGKALDEQLLLNLVRLRYRDTPLFLDFSSIVAQFSRSATALASLTLVSGGSNEGGLAMGINGSESPVLTLLPLKGEEFVRRMFQPIQPDSVVALAQSGWSVERLMVCCVQEIAGLRNAQTASGPTPAREPEFEEFRELASLLRKVQIAGGIDLTVDDKGALYFDLDRLPPDLLVEERLEIARRLKLPNDRAHFRLALPRASMPPGEISFVGRSLYGVLQLLAQGIEVPREDEELGRVTVTEAKDGGRFDWNRVLHGVFRAHASFEPPANAAVSVHYRDRWFWIADDDLDSKTTFSLLSLLFSLQAGEGKGQTPLLSIGGG